MDIRWTLVRSMASSYKYDRCSLAFCLPEVRETFYGFGSGGVSIDVRQVFDWHSTSAPAGCLIYYSGCVAVDTFKLRLSTVDV